MSQTVCQSLEQFHSLLFSWLLWLAMLQDPRRSGFHTGARMYPLHLLFPSTNTNTYVDASQLRIFPSWLIWFWHCLLWLSLAMEFTVGWNINTGLWSKNSFLTRTVVSGILYPQNSDKSNAQKLEIPININVYS